MYNVQCKIINNIYNINFNVKYNLNNSRQYNISQKNDKNDLFKY